MTLIPAAVDALVAFADGEVEAGRLPSAQLALAVEGEVVVRHAVGAADDARYTVFSVTKALTASAAWLLAGEGLAPSTLVVDVLPEFTDGGKERVTLEHLLTHTAGFPRAPMKLADAADPLQRREKYASWRLDSEPGTRTEYHATSAHWVVADLITEVAGADFREVVLSRILEPLGLRSLRLGLDADGPVGAVQPVVNLGVATEDGTPRVATPDQLLAFNDPAVRALGTPGAGAVSTSDDIAVFYQHLLHDPKGVWDPDVLADGTGHVRNHLIDPWTNVPALRTLGLSVAGDDGKGPLRQFGKSTGPRAFGASGVGGQIAWADPDTGLSFCFLTGGLGQDQVAAFVRANRLSTLAARCVPGAT